MPSDDQSTSPKEQTRAEKLWLLKDLTIDALIKALQAPDGPSAHLLAQAIKVVDQEDLQESKRSRQAWEQDDRKTILDQLPSFDQDGNEISPQGNADEVSQVELERPFNQTLGGFELPTFDDPVE